MDLEPDLPWHLPGFQGKTRDAVIELWGERRSTTQLSARALKKGMPRWVSELGSFEWVRIEYGQDVASFAQYGQKDARDKTEDLDGLWRLLEDYAAPLTRLTAAIGRESVRAMRAGLKGDNRKRLDDKLRDQMSSAICSALTASIDSRISADALLHAPEFPSDIVAISLRHAMDVAEAFAKTLQGPEDAADRTRILVRIGQQAILYGRNPPPPKPLDGARERAWQLIESEYLKLDRLERVPTFRDVYMSDVLGPATESVLKDLVEAQAHGKELTHHGILLKRVKQRAIDWIRKQQTWTKAKMTYSGGGAFTTPKKVAAPDRGAISLLIAELERDPAPEAPLAHGLLRDNRQLLRGNPAELRDWVADRLPEHTQIVDRDPSAVVERLKVLITEASGRAAYENEEDGRSNDR